LGIILEKSGSVNEPHPPPFGPACRQAGFPLSILDGEGDERGEVLKS